MTIRTGLISALLLLALASPDSAEPQQSAAPEKPVCTDLSGKVPLPCPGDADSAKPKKSSSPAGSAAKPEAAAPTAAGKPIRVFKPAPASQEPPPVRAQSAGQPIQAFKPAAQPPAPAKGDDERAAAHAEPAPSPVSSTGPAPRSLELALPLNLVRDQKNIWTSPLRVRLQDVQWLAPLLGATAVAIAADTSIQRELPTSASFIKHSNDFSNYGAAAFAGLTGGAYLWSRITGNEHMRETAVLSGEAAINTVALTYAIKAITQRDRPQQGDGAGRFWSRGDSFPSEHAAAVWSMASVIAHEYPGPLPTLLAYGGATAITAARVTARKHFASDALVGSALGWFVGREVYRTHHDRTDMAKFGTFERAPGRESPRDPANMGSPYVPLDSWVYPAMDRLAAMGYIQTAFAGLRPWTRMECARLVDEAADRLQATPDEANEPVRLVRSLQTEFAFETERGGAANLAAQVESLYTRVTGISGPPLTDGYHFGQTLINDYGRPYQRGANYITGFSARAVAGPLAFYIRGEYQHAPGAAALPLAARQTIASVDLLPVPPDSPVAAVDKFRLLEAYFGMNVDNWQITFGRQSLWWGPGQGGPMMLSDNAQPIDMIRFNRVSPITLPSILGWLGPIRTEMFIGRLEGQEFVFSPAAVVGQVGPSMPPGSSAVFSPGGVLVGQFGRPLNPQPFIHGQRISFKPTPNFEFGVSRTTIYGGPGYPLTAHTFVRSLFSTTNESAGEISKPGDRRSGFDLTYRLPGLRNWVTFYADGFADDEFSPIAYADRSAWHAGVYLPRLPRLHKLDLRAEGTYTDNPIGLGGGFYYSNHTWRNGYTDAGNLLGSWIGRQGQGAQAWSTYHFTPRSSLQFNFRHQKVSQGFIPGGGTLTDVGVQANLWVRSAADLLTVVQYERWTFPILAAGPQSNVTTSLQLTFRPGRWGKRR